MVRNREQNPFATVEAAFATTWTQYRCEQTMQLARFTLEQVPALGQALAAGRVDLEKVKVFFANLVGVVDEELMRTIVDLALPNAAAQSTAALRAQLRRILAKLDPAAVRRRRTRDHDDRFVHRHPEPSGLVTLVGRFLDPATTTAAYEHVEALAKATHTAGDPHGRSMDQLRADVYLDLLAGVDPVKAGHAKPADRKGVITVHVDLATLTGLAGLSGLRGLTGLPGGLTGVAGLTGLPGDPTRSTILTGLTGLTRPDRLARPERLRGLTGLMGLSGLSGVGGEVAGFRAAGLAMLADLANQPGEIAGYGPITAHIARQTAAQLAQVSTWRYAVSHDGQVIAEGAIPPDLLPEHTHELRRWAADATAGPDGRAHYRPSTAQTAFVRARDKTCQAPGCRVPAHRCQIDHRLAWIHGGPTIVDNLYCLCRRHHRAKDEAGYTYRPVPGGIEWTTPHGHRYTTRRPTHHRRHRRTCLNRHDPGPPIDMTAYPHRGPIPKLRT